MLYIFLLEVIDRSLHIILIGCLNVMRTNRNGDIVIIIPPKGLLSLRILLPISDNLSKRSPDSIDISSITRISVSFHLILAAVGILPINVSTLSLAKPAPDQECMVNPLILQAATPVGAVMDSMSLFPTIFNKSSRIRRI